MLAIVPTYSCAAMLSMGPGVVLSTTGYLETWQALCRWSVAIMAPDVSDT